MNTRSKRSALGTVVYGLLVIVPVAVVFLLLVKLTEILEKVAIPLGLESTLGAALLLVVATEVADCISQWGMGSQKFQANCGTSHSAKDRT